VIRLRSSFSALLLALALTACADKHADTPPTSGSPEKTPQQSEKKYKKPIRMHDRGKVSSISLEDFFLLQQSGKTLIIDARPTIFHQFGHIPGAISIPAKNCDPVIAGREEEIKKAIADGKTIVTYCSGLLCPDARTVAMHISGFGYPASVFSGGWDAWKDAGMPVE
jgi:3-mercaptopyruvate sulfurtransferase SseA